MGSSKDKFCCCGLRSDKSDYPLYMVRPSSTSLIARLNRLNPNETIEAGMLVCKNCRKKAEKIHGNGKNKLFS